MSKAVGIKAHLLAISDGHVYKLKKSENQSFQAF